MKIISPHKQKILDLTSPKIMGILNITPDSFSDGGRFNGIDQALYHTQAMIQQGADIVDIGGESTRPNAPMVSTEQELDRVMPIIQVIRQNFGDDLWLSIDTSNPIIMQQSVNQGVDIVNDVRGLRRDHACEIVAQLGCPVVIMHSRGEPDTMNTLAVYEDVVSEVINELGCSVQRAIDAGISSSQIIIDIGMGFAKNYGQHIVLMKNLDRIIRHFKLPMLFGVSRKRFLGELLTNDNKQYLLNHTPSDRDTIGAGMSLLAAQAGVNIIRVHDVAKTAQMLSMLKQLGFSN